MNMRCLLLIAIFITACSDKYSEQDKIQAINNVDAPFAAGALTFQISSDTDLNSLNGISNSCS
ncbi:type VI secretion protein, partial [Escherichia coli]|nr:type VI secretion protein [Escherichia coli]